MESNELLDIISFYNNNIKPFRYTYDLIFGTKLSFTFESDAICHLLFGKINNVPSGYMYKGQAGYNNILNKTITSVPQQLKKAYKNKAPAFYLLPKLLANPTAIYFNPLIIPKGSMGATTDIDGDFLLYKEIDNKNIHLFLKWIPEKKIFVPYSSFQNTSNTYINDQLKVKILNSSKIPR
jgi:hypothetical protein